MKRGMRFVMLLIAAIFLLASAAFAFDVCFGNADTPEETICQHDVFTGVTSSEVHFYDCSDAVTNAQQSECLLCEAGLTDPTSQLCIGLLNTFVLPGCTEPNENHRCYNCNPAANYECPNCDFGMGDCIDAEPIVTAINNAFNEDVPEFSSLLTGVLLVVLVVFLLVLNTKNKIHPP